MAESFFGTLTPTHRTEYSPRNMQRRDIARGIELFYNAKRRHSWLGYMTPQHAHDEYLESQPVA